MSSTPIQDPVVQGLSSGSGQTFPSRPLQPISDPSASKRVCFYKSGDYQFGGHRMVINARTFKTFDALLDALSKKVPLPFGVRTITTPRGTHLVKGLDDLQDGGSYVCSDRKRVKPLNLNEVNRRQVPWNTTRPLSAGRRRRRGFRFGQIGSRNEVRPAKVTNRVAVRTPKRLVVIKNRDPTVKRTIVLQRRTAPTFDSLLDYLSQILQFPVLKLYSTDGRRVDGLAALILCSGVVVAAGSEPFRLGNYSFHRTGQMAQVMYMETVEPSMLLPRAQNTKSFSSGRGSRNFSSSSERYIVNQINKSRNGSTNSHVPHDDGSTETELNQRHTFMETCGTGREDDEQQTSVAPQDDDIEKSFRVNQDGSMTVEMKVRLTIKEEEMLHWTTTLSRSSLSKRTACASISESGNSSPDSNNAIAKDSSSISEDETKEENHPTGPGKGVGFNDERLYEGYTSTTLGKAKTSFKRTPTPGPRHIKKKASVESVKTVTETGVQESTLGHYSYMERTADGETTEGYCVVRHSSSSNRPIPKPRKTASAETSNKGSHSSIRSSGVAEVLQIQNNGMEITETVMHIYESQGCYDNYLANDEYSADGVPLEGSTPAAESKPSTEPGSRSSSNDCDIDFSCQPSTADPLQRQGEEMLSLSSEPMSPAHEIVKQDKIPKNKKSSTSRSSSDKKLNENMSISPSKTSKHSSTDKLSNVSVGKKSLSSSESAKSGQKRKEAEKRAGKSLSEKSIKDEVTPKKDSALLGSLENMKKNPPKRQSMNKVSAKDNGHNVNTPTARPQMKKNMSDILQPKKSLLPGRRTVSKPKSMTENKTSSTRNVLELSESVSMPLLNPTPSDIHQYVENWLETVSQDQVPYTESIPDESEPRSKVVFKIGGDSESDEMSDSQNNLNEYYLSGDTIKKSTSCLSVPLYHEGPETTVPYNEQKTKGLCVSMPSVRVDPVPQGNTMRAHKSAEAIGSYEDESTSSNTINPTAKIKPVLRQLCSSIQCIRRPSETNTPSNLEKSSSLPDFSTQVASVFGSSCKAFLSFLSVMTLRDSLTGPGLGDSDQSRSTSEAMLMMESLQKISTIENEEEQRASLTDLQSRASSDFRERWKDFQIMRERLESEPLSPKVSETEFALDVVSEGGDAFEDHQHIDELLEELNMPQDIRAEISSTIQHARSFYPVEESTFVETDKNQSETEEDVENFVDECNDETKQPTDSDAASVDEKVTEKERKEDDGNMDVGGLSKMRSMLSENVTMTRESQQEADEVEVKGSEVSQRGDEVLEVKDETEERVDEDQVEGDRGEDGEGVRDREDGAGKEINEFENMKEEGQEEKDEMAAGENDEGQEECEAEEGSCGESVAIVDEGTEEDVPADEREKSEEGEKDAVEETEEGLVNEEEREDDCAEETDEREMVEEILENEIGRDEHEVEEEAADEETVDDEEEAVEETGENIEDKEDKEKAESRSEEEVTEEARDAEEKPSEADEKEVDVVSENDVEEDDKETTIDEEEEREKEAVDEVTEDNIDEKVEDDDEKDEVEDFSDEMEEKDVDLVVDNDVEEEEEEKEGNVNEKEEIDEEEVDVVTEDVVEEDVEKDVEEAIQDTDEEKEVENLNGGMEEREEEEVDEVMENDGEEVEEVMEEKDMAQSNAEERVQEVTEEAQDEEEGEKTNEVDVVSENDVEEDNKDTTIDVEEEKEEVDEVTEENTEEKVEEDNDEKDEVEDFSDEMEERDVDLVIDNDEEEEEEEKEENNEKEEEDEEEVDMVTEDDLEEDVDEVIKDTDEEQEVEEKVENMNGEIEEEEEEEVDEVMENDGEEEVEEVIEEKEEEEVDAITEKDEEETENLSEGGDEEEGEEEEGGDAADEEEEEANSNDEVQEQEEEEVDVIPDKDVEEEAEKVTEKDEEEEAENISEEEEEEETAVVDMEKDEEEFKMEVVSVSEDDDGDAEGENTDRRAEVLTDDEEEKSDKDTVEEDKGDEGNAEDSLEEKSVEAEKLEIEINMKAGQTDEEMDDDDDDDDEENELNKELEQVGKQQSMDEVEEGNDDEESSVEHNSGENLLEEASYMQQHSGAHDETNVEHITESPTKYSSEGQGEFDKGSGNDTADDLETDEGQYHEERSNSLPHPAEISQELLDFVNSALQSSSLKFTYDTQGKIRIEPENARVVQTKMTAIPKSREDSSYGLNRLPSPSTSDLTDYRPETSESGGYKSQESIDVVTESGEEAAEKPFPVYRRKTHIPKGTSSAERAASKASVSSNSEILQSPRLKSPQSFSSFESGTKASREDLSYFSATSSLKGDAEAAPGATQYVSFTSGMDTGDGVLIDRGRWLLKENHLIRKSPPVSLGMYGNLDSTSIDTGQENTSEDSPPHYKTQHNPLAAISSSELEEMAKPQTPKCTYYNMPHGSDSDPFLDDSSIHSQKKDTGSVKGRGVRVSPTIDTSKTWSNKNGSLSSFTSVEFKIADRKVHPEGESSAVTQARRPPSGRVHALQAQDSLDAMRVRCGQYCPIL